MSWQLTIGLEVHVELKTKTKMFCGCKNDPFHSPPNTNICPVCYGLPGSLPLLNKEAIRLTVVLGQALNGKISQETFWARKNYFYPDLPKGYQISQSTSPLIEQAILEIAGTKHRISRIHLEEDAGKSLHQGNSPYSLVDYNRAGVPLMEMVTEPDFHSAADSKAFCQELQRVMRSLGISDADMEKGQMRCELNISVSKSKELGTKVEVKNINSFRALEKAAEYEFERQVELLEGDQPVIQETRSWNNETGQTVAMRTKETSADYRYFPEPDLPRVAISYDKAAKHRLPDARRASLEAIGAPSQIAKALVDKNLDGETLVINNRAPKLAKEAAHLMLESPAFAGLSVDNKLSLLKAKQENGWTKDTLSLVMGELAAGKKVAEVIEGYATKLDLSSVISDVLSTNEAAVSDFKNGKESVLNFLVGQVMAKTQGKANINTARDALLEILRQP